MNVVDIIIVAIVVAAMAAALYFYFRKGMRHCSGNCDSCGGCSRFGH